MSIDTIKNRLDEMCSHILFDYNGKGCGIDPLSRDRRYDMWYGNETYTAKSIDEAVTVPLFDGKSLKDIVDKIENVEL